MTSDADIAANLEPLEVALGYTFEDQSLLLRALTHRSYANEAVGVVRDNQRLEFLGDAVLGLVIAEALFEAHPDYQEGGLSKCKAQLVCESTLASIARRLQLGDYLRLGRGEEASGGREKSSVLADAYEAVVAAVHLDGGFDAADAFVIRHHADAIREMSSPIRVRDAKSRLQELIQQFTNIRPEYVIVDSRGPDHARVFSAEVRVLGDLIGRGEGRSKKGAQQRAAAAALERRETLVERLLDAGE